MFDKAAVCPLLYTIQIKPLLRHLEGQDPRGKQLSPGFGSTSRTSASTLEDFVWSLQCVCGWVGPKPSSFQSQGHEATTKLETAVLSWPCAMGQLQACSTEDCRQNGTPQEDVFPHSTMTQRFCLLNIVMGLFLKHGVSSWWTENCFFYSFTTPGSLREVLFISAAVATVGDVTDQDKPERIQIHLRGQW